jgi:hypothetical protein
MVDLLFKKACLVKKEIMFAVSKAAVLLITTVRSARVQTAKSISVCKSNGHYLFQ